VYFSSNVHPLAGTCLGTGQHEMYQGVTEDGGKSWKFTALTQNSDVPNLRPVVVAKDGWHALLWLRGTYPNYKSYNQDVVGVITKLDEQQ
jgi:hypothetical protein